MRVNQIIHVFKFDVVRRRREEIHESGKLETEMWKGKQRDRKRSQQWEEVLK